MKLTLEQLERNKDELHIELRELLAKRTEIDYIWKNDGIPTDVEDRVRLNRDIDRTKLELTRAEAALREAKREGRMDKYDALCFVCIQNGHENYITEAEALGE